MENQRQYQREMEEHIRALPSDSVPHLLLHSCCGPCSTAVLEQLMPYFNITLLYYNPNIAPKEEFKKRLSTQRYLLQNLHPIHELRILAPPYDESAFWNAVGDAKDTPEMGERCERCIAQRMEQAAQIAADTGCSWFTTTLSVSPHKNADFVNHCGEGLAQKYHLQFLPADFKKRGGYARSVALSKTYHLYRQDYCGCPMSLKESQERRAMRYHRQNPETPR